MTNVILQPARWEDGSRYDRRTGAEITVTTLSPTWNGLGGGSA